MDRLFYTIQNSRLFKWILNSELTDMNDNHDNSNFRFLTLQNPKSPIL